MPDTKAIHLVVSFVDRLPRRAVDLASKAPGFVISPFVNQKGEKAVFIPAELYYSSEGENRQIEIANTNDEKKQTFLTFFNTLLSHLTSETPYANKYYNSSNQNLGHQDNQQDSFVSLVNKGIDAIKKGQFQKVVIARTNMIDLSQPLHLVNAFENMAKKYPNTFVSLVSTPEHGTWMGASPELLMNVNQDHILRTMALAGTKPATSDWTQKEIEEQEFVKHFIVKQFQEVGVQKFDVLGPKTFTLGHLIHLKTDFTVDLKSTVQSPELVGTSLLHLLHPTPAVCGLPKQPALHFINQYESFDRSFYTGYLGPTNIQDETSLYVNLRCMQLLDDKAILYAGAGITRDSDPIKEWEETNLKIKMLLKVIKD
jgi:isochorismate synthase